MQWSSNNSIIYCLYTFEYVVKHFKFDNTKQPKKNIACINRWGRINFCIFSLLALTQMITRGNKLLFANYILGCLLNINLSRTTTHHYKDDISTIWKQIKNNYLDEEDWCNYVHWQLINTKREKICFESSKTMACGINKNCSVKLHVKIFTNGRQYYKHNCTSFFVRHFDIPCRFFMHSASNSSEKLSLNLGLKNIMIYVMTFLVMTGKKHNRNYKLLNKIVLYK